MYPIFYWDDVDLRNLGAHVGYGRCPDDDYQKGQQKGDSKGGFLMVHRQMSSWISLLCGLGRDKSWISHD